MYLRPLVTPLALIVTLTTSVLMAADSGMLDTSFVPKIFTAGEVQVVATAPNGQVYVGGNFDWINGQPADWLVRLNADGSVDTSFNPVRVTEATQLLAIAPQADGSVLIGYEYDPLIPVYSYPQAIGQQDLTPAASTQSSSQTKPSAKRSLSNFASPAQSSLSGSVAPSHTGGHGNGATNPARSHKMVPAPSIIAGGRHFVIPPGSLGASTGSGPQLLTGGTSLLGPFLPFPAGSLLIGNNPIGMSPSGPAPILNIPSPAQPSPVQLVPSLPNDGPLTAARIIRLNSDGSLDPSFISPSLEANEWDDGSGIKVLSFIQPMLDGTILVGGRFLAIVTGTTSGQILRPYLVRLSANGSLSPFFAAVIDDAVAAALPAADGGIYIGGRFAWINGVSIPFGLAKIRSDGSSDPHFRAHGRSRGPRLGGLATGPGNTLMMATISDANSDPTLSESHSNIELVDVTGGLCRTLAVNLPGIPLALARYDANTAVLLTLPAQDYFRLLLPAPPPPKPSHIAFVPLTIVSPPPTTVVLDYQPSGLVYLDHQWLAYGGGGPGAPISSMATGFEPLVPPGVVAKAPKSWTGNSAVVTHLAASPGLKMIVSGSFTFGLTTGGAVVSRPGLARLDANGDVDANFVPPAIAVCTLLANADGGATILGSLLRPGASPSLSILATFSAANGLYQITSTGEVDRAFRYSIPSDDSMQTSLVLARQRDGKLLVGGIRQVVGFTSSIPPDKIFSSALRRFNPDGTEDTAFAPVFAPYGSINASVTDIQIDTDGALLISGTFGAVNGISRLGTVRLFTNGTVDAASLSVPPPWNWSEAPVQGLPLPWMWFTSARMLPRPNGGYLITLPFRAWDPNVLTLDPDGTWITADEPSPFLGSDSTGAPDPTFNVAGLVPTPTISSSMSFWMSDGYGVKFISPLPGAGWVAMTFGLKDATTQRPVSLLILGKDGSINRTYTAPNFASPPAYDTAPDPNPGHIIQAASYINDMIVQQDGSIVLGGTFWSVNGEARSGLAKLLPVPPAKAP